MKRIKKGRNKKAKALYDALRYRKKKLINIITEVTAKLSNIYGNKYKTKKRNIFDYTKAEIENLYKKAVYEKDKRAQKIIKELGQEYRGGQRAITSKLTDIIQDDLRKNIYGTRPSKLRKASVIDMENFDRLINGLTEEQKIEFLNSTKYYGARRYNKPPAESETFAFQVEQDGASYIVQDLIKYYRDKGLTIPSLLNVNDKRPKTYKATQKKKTKNKAVQMKF